MGVTRANMAEILHRSWSLLFLSFFLSFFSCFLFPLSLSPKSDRDCKEWLTAVTPFPGFWFQSNRLLGDHSNSPEVPWSGLRSAPSHWCSQAEGISTCAKGQEAGEYRHGRSGKQHVLLKSPIVCSKKSNQGKLAYWTNCKVLGERKLGKPSPPQRENFFTSAETMIIQLVTNDDTMMHM